VEVFIARDGISIGEYPHQNLERLAQAGELQPTDDYWHNGMTEWQPLSKLLGPHAWDPEPPAKAPLPKVPVAVVAKRFLQAAGIAAIFVLTGGLLIYLDHSSDDAAQTSAGPIKGAISAPAELPTDSEVRDKAAEDLRQKIEKLPARPVSPLHTFYYDVAVQMKKTLFTRAPWTATIQGGENMVEPGTENTIQRTQFILLAEYEDGEWTYKGYQASSTNMADFTVTEVLEPADTATPPSLVFLLGLKMKQ